MNTNENENTTTTPAEKRSRARMLLLSALDSWGSEAIGFAESARALVGVVGIGEIAREIGGIQGAYLLGALRAMLGDPVPLDDCTTESEAGADGFAFVEMGGFLGAWA